MPPIVTLGAMENAELEKTTNSGKSCRKTTYCLVCHFQSCIFGFHSTFNLNETLELLAL